MLDRNVTKVRAISAKILNIDIEIAKTYIKDVVDDFCNKYPQEKFSVRILFGGVNKDWNGTPLQKIYDYYILNGYSNKKAFKKSAIDVGRLLKTVLVEDKQKYLCIKGYTNEYKIIIDK